MTATLVMQASTLTGPGNAGVTPTLTYDIGVDIDDVIHPWYLTAHGICELAGITNGITPKTWRMAEEYGCDKDAWVKVLEQATKDGTLYGVAPIPGAVEALRRLHWAGHRIHLITARGTAAWQSPAEQAEIHRQSWNWIWEYAVPHDTVHFESDKAGVASKLDLDWFVDDGVHNFQDLEHGAPKVKTYLMTAPHNGDFWTPFRLETMDEFVDLVIEAGEKGAQGGC